MANHKKIRRLPGVTRRMVTFALATVLLFPTFSVKAADDGNGKTKVNLGVTEVKNSTVSYEVPLYCTLAIVEEKDKNTVFTPSNYDIKNTAKNKDKKLAVTGLAVSSVDGGAWNLGTEAEIDQLTEADSDKKIMNLVVGGVELKKLGTVGNLVKLGELGNSDKLTIMDLTAKDNAFCKFNNTNKTFVYSVIGEGLSNISLSGKVSKFYKVTTKRATAQFRLYYTVSVLNDNGDVIGGWSYKGPDKDGNPVVIVGGETKTN